MLTESIAKLALTLFAGIGIGNLLPSYFKKKGENFADKQDIRLLTEIVEGVKTQFTDKTNLLNANLQRLIGLEASHRNEERSSIIDFHGKYSTWLYSLNEINAATFSKKEIFKLIEKYTSHEKYYSETIIALSRVELLVNNSEIIKLANDLLQQILVFRRWIEYQLISLHLSMEERDEILEYRKTLREENGDKDEIINQSNRIKELGKEIKELALNYNGNKITQYRQTATINIKFTEAVKKYLTT